MNRAVRSLLGRVAGTQAVLAVLCWVALGWANAQRTWLLEPGQSYQARRFLFIQLPLLGVLAAVFLPTLLAFRLWVEATESGLPGSDLVGRVLDYPRRVALIDLVASVLLFLFAAFRLRTVWAIPPIEAGKIAMLGLLTGTLYAVLTYFILQRVMTPVLELARESGALAPEKPSFSIREKVFVCCLAMGLLVAGLFGEEALTWSQRWEEGETQSAATATLASAAAAADKSPPQGRAGWMAFLRKYPRPVRSLFFVVGVGENIIATYPEKANLIDAHLLTSDFFGVGHHEPRSGAFVTRWGDVRVVARRVLSTGEILGLIASPDPTTLRYVFLALLAVTLEAAIAAFFLAAVAGRGITRPLEDLRRRLASFSLDDEAGEAIPPVWADDETLALSADFETMAQRVREARRQIQEGAESDSRSRLLAQVAHEVRNPLFGISSTLAALRKEVGPGAHDEYFGVLQKQVERLSRLIERMLAGGKPDAGENTADLIEALNEAESSVGRRHAGQRLEVAREGWPKSCPVPLRPDDAISVFANLFDNAVQASGDETWLRVSVECDAARVSVSVADRGAGVPEEVRANLFDSGVSGRAGGTGLGLTICRAIVEAAGGSVELAETGPGGSRFVVRLPRAKPV